MATLAPERNPTSVGPYQLVERVGKGGMGSVYRAVHPDSGAVLAVKILKPELAEDATLLGRFLQEFRSAFRLDHPNIVTALDAGMSGRFAYLVMEYVDGPSLGTLLNRSGKMPEGQAVRLVTQVAQALHYAHRNRVIHRDVKPDNILVRADGLAKLADFGLAKDIEDGACLTRSRAALGTPHFMAPEQYADAKRVGVQGDVYSLGATLYAAVTGRLPFADCSTLTALAKKVKGDIPAPRKLVPGLSEEVDLAIRRAMSPDLAKRPTTCLEFVKLLPTAAQWAKPAAAAGPGPRDRRTSARRVCIVGATCAVNTSLFAAGAEAKEDWPGVVQDVSAGGVGVVLARRFETGTLLTIELNAGLRAKTKVLLGRVVRVRAEGMGHWRHGCALVGSAEDADLVTLVAAPAAPAEDAGP